MRARWAAVVMVWACTEGGKEPEVDTPAETDPPCSRLRGGDDWAFDGECPQMHTPCEVAVDGCALTISYEATGMTMGMPYAATIDGDLVTFEDGDLLEGCTGTVLDARTIEGSCAGGCTFSLSR